MEVDFKEEEYRGIKTLKRLDHTNSSVVIDEMNNYQATYNKRWQDQFTFVGSRPQQHSWPVAATINHDEMLSFG